MFFQTGISSPLYLITTSSIWKLLCVHLYDLAIRGLHVHLPPSLVGFSNQFVLSQMWVGRPPFHHDQPQQHTGGEFGHYGCAQLMPVKRQARSYIDACCTQIFKLGMEINASIIINFQGFYILYIHCIYLWFGCSPPSIKTQWATWGSVEEQSDHFIWPFCHQLACGAIVVRWL